MIKESAGVGFYESPWDNKRRPLVLQGNAGRLERVDASRND